MNLRRTLSIALLCSTCALPLCAQQQPKPAQPSVTAHGDTGKSYPIDQLVTATVHDAWVMSGKNEDAFFEIVEQLAQYSAQKRNLTLPDSEAAGRRMGEIIKTRAKADHEALLYSIVDQAVRTVAGKSTTTASNTKH